MFDIEEYGSRESRRPQELRVGDNRPVEVSSSRWTGTVLLVFLALSGTVGAAQDFDALAAGADEAREQGRLVDAVGAYRSALEVRPDWAEGWWYLGTILYELDRFAEGIEAFDRLVRLVPAHGPARALKGLCEFREGRYDASLANLTEARILGISGQGALVSVVRYHLALLLTRVGRFEDALEILEEYAKQNVRTMSVIESFGLAALRMQVLPSEAPPQRREAILMAGRAAYEFARENFPTSESLYQQLISRYPEDAAAHYAFGFSLSTIRGRQGAGRDEPIALFKKAVELDPRHLAAHLQLAFEHLAVGKYGEARQYAARALELDPGSFAAHFALGQSLLEVDPPELDLSIRSLEEASRLAPDVASVRFVLSRAYQRAGRTEDAARQREEFRRLTELKEEWVRKVLK